MKPHSLLALFLSTLGASGQVWETMGPGFRPGSANALLYDTTTSSLIAAGDFGIFQDDSSRANGIARWDGLQWHTYAGGVDGLTSGVSVVDPATCLARYNGEVHIGGLFWDMDNVPLTYGLGRWDGTAWGPVGTGSSSLIGVRGFTEIDGELHVVGGIDSLGGIAVPNWAVWDGATWRPGDTLEAFSPGLYKVQKYQGQLYAAGNYDIGGGRRDLTRLTPNGWEEPGPGLLGDCGAHDMEIYDGLLWVTGRFFQASGNLQSCIMAWDGNQWFAPFPSIDYFAQGRDLMVANGKLYGAGPFYVAGKPEYYGIWEYDGNQVCVIGGPKVYATSLAASADTLYAGMCTTLYCDGLSQNVGCVAKWPLDAPADTCFTVHVGVREMSDARGAASLSPNPLSTAALLHIPSDLSRPDELVWHDALGRVVRTDAPLWQGNALLIERGGLPPGVYVLRYGKTPGQTLRVLVQ